MKTFWENCSQHLTITKRVFKKIQCFPSRQKNCLEKLFHNTECFLRAWSVGKLILSWSRFFGCWREVLGTLQMFAFYVQYLFSKGCGAGHYRSFAYSIHTEDTIQYNFFKKWLVLFSNCWKLVNNQMPYKCTRHLMCRVLKKKLHLLKR